MSTYTSEPGTRLAGRYRLVDQTAAGTGWTYWKATDETLARPVTVLTFAPGFPRVPETVTAARAASRLGDSRFAQVFDVEDAPDGAYVVMEWVAGESLADLVSDGPLEPHRAASIVAEAAQAMAVAHRLGQAHLRLDPGNLHWTAGGGVKISGLGIDAALAGSALTATEDPELTDARDLSRLLYAGLTGYWPGPDASLLPPAPTDSTGEPCAPRQVAAGVPAGIDSVTCRALFQHQDRHGPALSTPAAFTDALTAIAPPAGPPPPPAAMSSRPLPRPMGDTDSFFVRSGESTGTLPGRRPDGPGRHGSYRRNYPATERSAVARGVVSVVIVVVLAAIGVTGWAISRSLHHTSSGPPAHQQQSSHPASSPTSVLLKPLSATVYNPLDSNPNSDDPSEAQYALGGQPGKFWHTSYYQGSPQFGNLKKGVGLLLDMGSAVRLSQLSVQFGTSCCAHVDIEIGNSSSPSALSSFTTVASSSTAAGLTPFKVTGSATGRYVLIWFTSLPPMAGSASRYQAEIYDVIVHGTNT
jgi:serine/threonine protein kinase